MKDDQIPLDELISRFHNVDTMDLPLESELQKLKTVLPHDLEMAIVRGRRIVDKIIRTLYTKNISAPGTRPLEQLIPELEKNQIIPREVVAHIRSLKEMANLCAHEGTSDDGGMNICLINLVVILKWFARSLETFASTSPHFHVIDGMNVASKKEETIREIIALDRAVFGEVEEIEFGYEGLSQSWYKKNPQIYSFLYTGNRLIGYTNIMPIEEEAWELALKGRLHDGAIEPEMIRRYEIPDQYRVYICSLAILPEFRVYQTAFGSLYDAIFDKFFNLTNSDIFISEIAANAWTEDGRRLCKSFGMELLCKHEKHGEVYHSTIIPPKTFNPSRKLRLLLSRYKDLGVL